MTRKLRRDILKQGGLALTGLASLTGLTSASSSDNNDDDDFSETVTGSGIQDESKLPENLQNGRNHSTTDDKELSVDRDKLRYVDHLNWETTLSAVGQDLADVENIITTYEMIDDDEEPVTDHSGSSAEAHPLRGGRKRGSVIPLRTVCSTMSHRPRSGR